MLRLKAERIRRGWSQLDVAYRARIQPSELSRLERGLAIPYPGQAARLATVFEITAEQLLQVDYPEAVAS